MQGKRFNNAIEKAENLSSDTKKAKGHLQDSGYENNEEVLVAQKHELDRANEAVLLAEQKRAKREDVKNEALRLKAERERQKARLKYERMRAEEERKTQREQERDRRRRERGSRGIGGWLAAVISLGCICLILTTVLLYDVFMTGSGEGMLSNVYSKSFYDLVGYVDNIDVNLSKLTASNNDENRQKILCDIMVQANLAEADISALPLEENSKQSTEKYMNQVGDFSKYLNNKLIEGDSITEEDEKILSQMKKINYELRSKLKDLQSEIGDDFDFITLLSGEENPVLNTFNELQYHSVEYPKMIYDGPFADEPEESATDNTQKAEKGKEISKEEAIKIFEKCFADYNPTEIKVSGMAEGRKLNVYNVEAKLGEEEIFAQISDSGKLVMVDSFTAPKEKKFNRDECIENAYKFLQKCGYKSIKAVWSSSGKENITYINFASVAQNGEIIMYSDLIKVGVCMNSGRVCDMDAHLYILNHKEREVPEVKIEVEDAERKISPNIEVESARLAIIPVTNSKERLAYEFYGKGDDGAFYIYIDAQTGKELKIFKVISTDDGELLL